MSSFIIVRICATDFREWSFSATAPPPPKRLILNKVKTKIREVENKIPDGSGLVKKTDYKAKKAI